MTTQNLKVKGLNSIPIQSSVDEKTIYNDIGLLERKPIYQILKNKIISWWKNKNAGSGKGKAAPIDSPDEINSLH